MPRTKTANPREGETETEGVNAFSLDWSNEFNLLVPPVYLISKTIHHFFASSSKVRAVLVCPPWLSATFWPLLLKKVNDFHEFVDQSFKLKDTTNYIKLEKPKVFYRFKNFKGEFLVFSLELDNSFTDYHYYFNLLFFIDIFYWEISKKYCEVNRSTDICIHYPKCWQTPEEVIP